jgi:hypothetical protein
LWLSSDVFVDAVFVAASFSFVSFSLPLLPPCFDDGADLFESRCDALLSVCCCVFSSFDGVDVAVVVVLGLVFSLLDLFSWAVGVGVVDVVGCAGAAAAVDKRLFADEDDACVGVDPWFVVGGGVVAVVVGLLSVKWGLYLDYNIIQFFGFYI